MSQSFNTNGMSLEELAALVQQQIAVGKTEPKNDADKALKANHMDIMHVHVPHQYKEYPKTLYKLKPASKRKPASVLTLDVSDLVAERAAVSDGWETARIEVAVKSEEDEELTPEEMKALLRSNGRELEALQDQLIDAPVGRPAVKAGRPPRGLQVTG